MVDSCVAAEDYSALIPCYENGNIVRVVSINGEITMVNKCIKQLIRDIERNYNIDVRYFKHNFGKYVGRKNIMPLPFGVENVFIPVKVRKSIGINDGSYAYINLKDIANVSGNERAGITLNCSFLVKSLESKATVSRRMEMGKIIREKYVSGLIGRDTIKNTLEALADEYSSPATKADIAMLIREMLLIKNKLEDR